MTKRPNYKFTFYACCLASVVQACIVNITPLLFIPLREIFGFSYGQLGLLVSVNFVTQFICDLTLGAIAERFGIKKFLIAAPSLAFTGFLLFSFAPVILPQNPYVVFILATVIFSVGGGLTEVLTSPVVNALPFENKASVMSTMHSFYAWGQVGVVLVTTLLIKFLGRESWQAVYLLWSSLALASALMFMRAKLITPQKGEGKKGIKGIIKKPMFLLALLIMLGGGAAEIGLSQWASSFMEKGMNIEKATGDILGMCMFAVMMGLGRTLFAKFGARIKVMNALILGAAAATVCYVAVAFSNNAVISLVFCALCGISVSLLWPCTLTITAEYFPLGGTMMFAILSGGGDAGCSSGPWLIGTVIDFFEKAPFVTSLSKTFSLSVEQLALRAGILSGAIFPIVTLIGLLIFKKAQKKNLQQINNLK